MQVPVLPRGWEEWNIAEVIGEGSYGTVYRAERVSAGETEECAIKVIRLPDGETGEKEILRELGSPDRARAYYLDMLQGYVQEIRTMNELKGVSAHIVNVEDCALEENEDGIGWTLFIRMELLTCFQDYAQTHIMTEEDVIRLGTELCGALESCEKAGIIHRDIKPANIFVDAGGHFKLGDFGVARKLDKTSGLYSAKGTFPYMAPEVYKNEPYDRRADLYSLGLVLYYLTNKRRQPFLSDEKQLLQRQAREEALMRRLKGETLPAPCDAGPALSRVILKACAYKPQDRYDTAEELRGALEKAGQKAAEKEKKRRWPVWLAVAAVLLAACVLWLTRPWEEAMPAVPTAAVETLTAAQETAVPVTEAPETGTPELRELELTGKTYAGLGFMGDEAVPYVNTARVLEALESAGCRLTEEEKETLRSRLLDQFRLSGKTAGASVGDTAEMQYLPEEDFEAMLSARGWRLVFGEITAEFK